MSHAQPPAPGAAAPPRANVVVAVLAFGGIVVSLMQTLVIPIVPELPRLLHATASNAAWAVTATLLAAAVATPVMGRLGDMYGKRLMLLFSLVMLVVGSVVCALSDSLTPMIVGRVLQGMASGVIPLGISIMRDEVPAERLAGATALMSASLGVGGALGLPAAALLADHYDWHTLFWVSAGLGVLVTLLVLLLVHESAVRSGGRFDLLGAIGMAAGLVCLLLGISKGADWGWTSRTTLGLFAAAVVVLLLWGWFELRARQPLVDLRTTVRRQVLFTNLASVATGFAMFGTSLILPQILELPKATGYGLGQSVLHAGLVLAPTGLVMMAMAPLSAIVTKSMGPKVTLMIGVLIVAVGYGLNIVLLHAVWELILASCVIGAGIGFAYGAMPALIMGAVPASETAAANSLNTLMRSLGTSISSAVAGAILAKMTNTFGNVALPSLDGFRTVMAIAGGAAVLAFLLAMFLPGRRRAAATAAAPAASFQQAEPFRPAEPAMAAPMAAASNGMDGFPQAGGAPSHAQPAPAFASAGAVPGDGASGGILVGGRVHSANNTPVTGAAVTLISLGGQQLGRSLAQGDGSYGIGVPRAGSYFLIASAAGHKPHASTIVVGDTPMRYDILLGSGSGLAGTVRAADSGTPVAGAVIVVTDAHGDVLTTGQTDALGEFTVDDLTPGTVTLAVNSPKHRPLALPVEIESGETARVDVRLQPGAQVRGTIRGGGAPLRDARVTIVDAAGNVVATTTTGLDGEYAFADLDGGVYTVVATGYRPQSAEVVVTGGDVDGHDLELAPGDE
ncbi:MFS transporter [Actinoallomurus oryzae]|uniref:MFS transporter n=1 Tax=Actinoallomurus oryzae TaxID=502180 RepID=A0ABP8Q229_9ACTN